MSKRALRIKICQQCAQLIIRHGSLRRADCISLAKPSTRSAGKPGRPFDHRGRADAIHAHARRKGNRHLAHQVADRSFANVICFAAAFGTTALAELVRTTDTSSACSAKILAAFESGQWASPIAKEGCLTFDLEMGAH
jgi:hypothetical protein